jgi:hypothetical protein
MFASGVRRDKAALSSGCSRKSTASLSVVPAAERPRPEPPEKMIEAEKVIWRETTAALRPDWFQGSECVLGAYVGAVQMERDIAAELAKYTPNSDPYVDLVRLRCLAISTMASLATKLRLTPQSTRDSRNVKLVSTLAKPWELDEAADRLESPPRSWNLPSATDQPDEPQPAA